MTPKQRMQYASGLLVFGVVLELILLVTGKFNWALLWLVLFLIALERFLRFTHPAGAAKPKLEILYKEEALDELLSPEELEKVQAERERKRQLAEERAEAKRLDAERREKERAEQAEQRRLAEEQAAAEQAERDRLAA